MTALSGATSVREACRLVAEQLAAPGLRPSVYLERGGRLRCQALVGYRQLLDGLTPWTGIIGRTFASGEESVVRHTAQDPDYLSITTGVVAEVCLPIRLGGRTIGALNVEASRPLTSQDVARVRTATAALERQIARLGGTAPESAAQRLVRHAIVLASESEEAALERAVLAAAVDLTPLDSAILLRRRGGAFVPGRAVGPLRDVLADAPAGALRSVTDLVASGCSVSTVTATDQGENDGVAALRERGVASLAAFPAGDLVLLVASRSATDLRTDECELLELLAAQAWACLRTAASVSVLRAQAATDPLTGLGHRTSFHAELAEAHAVGPVGVLVVDVDDFKGFNDREGHPSGDRALRATAAVMSRSLRGGDLLFRIGGDEFAAVLPGVAGADALEAGRRVRTAVADAATGLRVSIGAAAAREQEDPESVVARADRALYRVKAGGRDGVALDVGAPIT